MPLLDVSEILFDPDFADTLTLERSTVVTGSNGMAVRTPAAPVAFYAVVTSSSGDILARLAEGRQRHGSITVHTRTRLVAGQGATEADVVVYDGQHYTVTNVNSYARYGAGFIAAECELQAIT
ncbi:hypothetical protein LB518_22780 [Mesorhizobium sp. BR1-1-16]|uniref:hypothetical protein n=1 Tax=Mesorhizobium sp. BR1-1-16 TaxID=2876653 RepID=UPI001CCB3D47|nr:hypothetical protein [Mesorhizobium sp. BR1-1-16]MBZ9939140.1 hypothetical protein [Mesorhizobium sp. BR1-1-16]